jgi:hypothetical protein
MLMRALAALACMVAVCSAVLDVEANHATSLPPSLIGIGAQKAGSTTLYSYMTKFSWIGKNLL